MIAIPEFKESIDVPRHQDEARVRRTILDRRRET